MTIYSMVITLFLVMDPIGGVPIFLVMLSRYTYRRYAWIIIRESLLAWLLLSGFIFFGHGFMKHLNISESAMNMAGAMVLLLIAIKMIFPTTKGRAPSHSIEEPLIVPLAVPMIAGPSALATVMLFSSREADHLLHVWLSVCIAIVIFIAIMLLGRTTQRLVGDRVLNAMERLMGMILTMIAMQMFINGLQVLLAR